MVQVSDSLTSRMIQAYGFLALIIAMHIVGAQHIFGFTGITPGYNLIESVASYTFVHFGDDHLWSNVSFLVPLMGLFALVERKPLAILAALIVVSGVIIWAIEVDYGAGGASALFCALIPYIVIRGIGSMEPIPVGAGIVTAFFFHRTLWENVDPSIYGMNYGHIGGAIGGALVAAAVLFMRRSG